MVHSLDENFTSSIMSSTERLPWGSSPLESCVLAHWASHPTDEHNERRRQLTQRFAAIGYSGRYVGA